MNELAPLLSDVAHEIVAGKVEGVTVSDVTMRSTDVRDGSLFACVPGSARDGHDFAADAAGRGATALLVEHPVDVDPSIVQVQVPSVREAVGPIADAFFGRPSRELMIAGVTGTNGKTTTSHLLHAIFEAAGKQCGVVGTVGATVGGKPREVGFTTPEAIDLQRLFRDMLDSGDRACAMEVSSHALEQRRTRNTRFSVVGFTNLTRDHLDYHRGFEAYFLAKRRLFDETGPDGEHWPAAVNCDDEWGSRLFDDLVHGERVDVPVWGYTVQGMARASVSAKFQLTDSGATIFIESPVGDFTLTSQLRGGFNVENVLCATTMALLAGVTPEQVQLGLDAVPGVRGRFEPVVAGQPFDVFVDYAHTPDSLEQVLATARDICDGKVITVFGCGGDRDRTKRPVMGRAAAQGADIAVITSDNPRSEDPDAIIAEIRRGMRKGARVLVEPDRRAAIELAIEQAEPGDILVIAGKGHEQGQIFADGVVPFDDATVAREALKALAVS